MKTPLINSPTLFDLKFLLVGDSKSGKTHFTGTYTKGPIHYYMFDPGGEKTLHKLNKNRNPGCEITIDKFSIKNDSYTTFWKQLQQDEKDGFFQEMADRNGLLVLPDSLSTLNDMVLEEVAKKNKRTLTSLEKPLRSQDWGMIGQWLKELTNAINEMPCAVISIAHLLIETDKEGTVLGRYPYMATKMRTRMGLYYDEIYLLDMRGTKRKLVFHEKAKFQAGSRIFLAKDIEIDNGTNNGITMDELATAYLNGDDLTGRK